MPILRIFSALAVVSGVLLVLSVASGVWNAGESGPSASLGLATLATTLLAHGSAVVALSRTGRRARSLAAAGTAWPGAQATRNQARARPFAAIGASLATLAAVWAGGSAGRLVVASASLAFNLGALALEWASIRAQVRLLGDVEGRFGTGEDRR